MRKVSFPDLRAGTKAERRALAESRALHVEGLDLAVDRGFLRFAKMWDGEETPVAWVITDSTRRNAQARRLDGKPGQSGKAAGAKAKTLPGSQASWPIGIADLPELAQIVITEGGTDYLAAWHFLWGEAREDYISPVAMLGAGMSIHPDALPFFKNRRIRIFTDMDSAGLEAGERWARQLYRAGATYVDRFSFDGLLRDDGKPVRDLNDLCRQSVNSWEADYGSHEIFNF